MAQISCKYHPLVAARWFCTTCHINYCHTCMPSKLGKRGPVCTVCKEALQSVGTGNAITPFWVRSGLFFLYPLHISPLSLIILLTVINTQFNQSLVGVLLQLATSVVFMKYAYAILDETAQGRLKPPRITAKVLNSELELPIKQLLLTFTIAYANFTMFNTFGATVAGITVFISMFAFPANVMVLAVERSFFAAFNPIIIMLFIKRIGLPYLLLSVFLLLLTSASGTVMSIAYESTSKTNFILLSSIVTMYFMLIIYHLLGYILYQYHEQLGLHIDLEEDEKNIATGTKRSPAIQASQNPELRHVEILLQEGKTEEANNKIAQIIHDTPADHDARMMNLKLQKLLGNMQAYEKHAHKYINYLFDIEKFREAAKVITAVLVVMPNFKPEKANERLVLAKSLKQSGQNKAAVKLINNLHIDFPNFKQIPEAYLLAASILCDNLGEDKQAKAILEFLLKKYPNCEQTTEIKNYLSIIKNLNLT